MSAAKPHLFFSQFVACMLCMTTGPILIFINKHLLSTVGFRFPAQLTSNGVFCSTLFAFVSVHVFGVKLPHKAELNWRIMMTSIIPVGVCQMMTFVTGKAAYLYLGVAYIQMLKGVTIICVMVLSFFMGLKTPSLVLVVSVLIISFGVILSSVGEASFSFIGIVMMGLSIITEALRTTLAQVLFGKLKFSVIESQYYTGPVSVLGLWLCTAIFEWDGLVDHGFSMMAANPILFLLSATLGLCVNFSSLWVTQTCSALTLQIVVTLRNIVIVIVSVFWLGELVTDVQTIGYCFSVLGMVAYKNSGLIENQMDECQGKGPRAQGGQSKKDDSSSRLLSRI